MRATVLLLLLALTAAFLAASFSLADNLFTPSFAIFVFEYGYFLALGLLAYFHFRRRPEGPSHSLPWPAFRLLCVVFLLTLGSALLSVAGAIYERPLAYYALAGGATTAIFLQALACDLGPARRRLLILLEAVALPVINNYTLNRVQPYLFGADSLFHMTASAEIAATGALPGWMGAYVHYPWFQVLGAVAMLVSGGGTTAFVVASFTHPLVTLLAAYLVLRRLTSERGALLGTLFVLVAPNFMTASIQYAPTKAGLALLVLAIWVSLKVTTDRRFWAAYLLIFVAAFLYHPVFGFLLVVLSLSGALASRWEPLARLARDLVALLRGQHQGVAAPRVVATGVAAPLLFSVVTYVAYLAYVGPEIFEAIIAAFTFTESQLPASGSLLAPPVTPAFVVESMLSSLGMTAVLLLAVPTFLLWIREARHSARRFFALTYVTTLGAIGLVSVGDLFLLGPVRFLGTLDLFAAMAAGPGLAFVLARAGPPRRTMAVAAALLLGLATVSSMSYRVDSNSYLSQGVPTGLGYLQQDAVASAEFLHAHATPDTTVFMDFYMQYWTGNFPHRSPLTIYDNPVKPDHILSIHNAHGGSGLYILNERSAHRQGWEVATVEAEIPGASQVYDGGNVRILVQP